MTQAVRVDPSGAGASHSSGELSFNPDKLWTLYKSKRHRELSESLLTTVDYFRGFCPPPDPAVLQKVGAITKVLLDLLIRDDFVIPRDHGWRYVSYLPVWCNLLAHTTLRNTDRIVAHLAPKPEHLPKLLALHGPRNNVRVPMEEMFARDANLASVWYAYYVGGAPCAADPVVYENLRRHVRQLPAKYQVFGPVASNLLFMATYIDHANERALKGRLHHLIRTTWPGRREITCRPNRRKIAIATHMWAPTSPVYRSAWPFVQRLAERYDLTLLDFAQPEVDRADLSCFERVIPLRFTEGGQLDLSAVLSTDFQMVYYLDVGMSHESRFLSNLRLAPIQAVGYGHPASTYGAQMDYFIGGADVEVPELAGENYSERLVLIPGIGVHPVRPSWAPPEPPVLPACTETIVVNCPWTNMKVNHPLVQALRAAAEKAPRPVRFQFFPSWPVTRNAGYIPFLVDLQHQLGPERVTVHRDVPPPEYLKLMARGHCSADAYPFGGYNTIVDSLVLARPVVTWEGSKFFNRAASRLLKDLGLGELVATDRDGYVQRLARLIHDDAYRQDVSDRMRSLDLEAELFSPDRCPRFDRVIEHLIAHHADIQADRSRKPVCVDA